MKNISRMPILLGLTVIIAACSPLQPASSEPKATSEPVASTPVIVATAPAKAEEPTTPTVGKYVEYSRETFEKSSSQRRVLFFYANWCSTCRPADSSFNQNVGRLPADLVLLRVNYNDTATDQEEKDLAAKYGITYQHTFVQIDAQGNAINRWNGGEIDQLLAKVQ